MRHQKTLLQNRMVSASDEARQTPATNTQQQNVTYGIRFGGDTAAANEQQRTYITQKRTEMTQKRADIDTRYGNTLFRTNARDAEIVRQLFEEALNYLSANVNADQKAVEAELGKINTKIDNIINGLVVRTGLLQLVEIFQTTVKSQPSIQGYTLTDADKRALLNAAGNMGKFYNANPEGTRQSYLDAVAKELIALAGRSPVFENYLNTTLASSPEYSDISLSIRARRAGIVTEPSDVMLWDRLIKKTSTTFITALSVGLALWGGTLAANDAIFRSRGYRILNFIYGSVFFFISLPYYAYRYFKNKSPTLFALLPLTTQKPETFFQKLIYGLFWYVENIPYENKLAEQWYKVSAREAGVEIEEPAANANANANANASEPAAAAPAATPVANA
jgi:hypothetical protein